MDCGGDVLREKVIRNLEKIRRGAVLLYAGFIFFFVGPMMNGNPVPFPVDMIMKLIPLNQGSLFLPSILQLLGGLSGVTGFILCIWPTKPPSLPAPAPPTIIIQKVPEPAPRTTNANNTTLGLKCKFCGSILRKSEVFCPSCSRSQT